jgi:hypothetical protein
LFVSYDGYNNTLSWTGINTSSGLNYEFLNYEIYTNIGLPVTLSKYENDLLYSDSFVVGKYVYIFDKFKKSKWYGIITTAGQFSLLSNKITTASDIFSDYTTESNFECYIESGTDVLVGTSVSATYVDTIYNNYRIFYKVKSVCATRTSQSACYPILNIPVADTYPYIRSLDNSDSEFLNNIYWKKLKNVLIDSNYYDKSEFAVPYSKNDSYNLKGFLGVSHCKVDLYVNGIYNSTTSTGLYGEFDIDFNFDKGKTTFYIQCRDRLNIEFSRKSIQYQINTVNIQTYFWLLGKQYKEINETLDIIKLNIKITSTGYTAFEEIYSPFADIYKSGLETDEAFVAIASEVFKSYEYTSYDRALSMVLDIIQQYETTFDHYDIFYNNRLYKTFKTGRAFISRGNLVTSTGISLIGLDRAKYYYGVTSVTSTGEETDATIITCDCRWWPLDYKGLNVITWTPVNNIFTYKVYRGTSTGSLEYLVTANGTMFVDSGYISTSTGVGPPPYNFIDENPPAAVEIYYDTHLSDIIMKKRVPYYIILCLYAVGSTTIPDYQISRILTLMGKHIPPEYVLKIVYANDDSVEIFT